MLSRRKDVDGRDSNRDPGQINSAQRSKGSKGAKISTGTRSSDQLSATGQKYKYMLFVWNGKNAGASVKA